jgi:hypothetical protein
MPTMRDATRAEARPGARSGRAGGPLGLLGMLALVAAIERSLARHADHFCETPATMNRLVGRDLRRHAPGSDVLLFGDSQVKMGLAPGVIEARSGRRTYNFGLIGTPPPVTYFLLRRALALGARPEAVVVDYKANIVAAPYRVNLRTLPEVVTPAEAAELAWAARDAGLFAHVLAAKALPSYRRRPETRSAVATALAGGVNPLPLVNAALRRNGTVNRGAMLNPPRPWSAPTPLETLAYFGPDWQPDPLNARYVHRFLRLAESRGIKVYWLIAPISPETLARREVLGLDAQYTRWVDRMRSRHRNVTVVDARRSGYEHDVFMDPAHLDARGAAALSLAMGDVLRRAPTPAEAWTPLPPFRPAEVALEHLDQSRHALATRGRAPRR